MKESMILCSFPHWFWVEDKQGGDVTFVSKLIINDLKL